MDSQTQPDFQVSDIADWLLRRLPADRTLFTRDEIVDLLLDLRQEFDR